ncbi:propionyl-CoA carboxylase [Gemmiger sp. An120]|uniref:carboxyl transferase domain-containing protein n=1 Tax=Gemmiger TaxID=204475 RepID=UPI000B378C8C|nr:MULTISPECIES: carboxyl transferase domain-containing protein [Gemmiger]MBM6916658.1 propionyl-CoA carboxylase [Gemmiger formicilis]OUQ44390.1 propionyl-CoA carboxylase [Gemmiger sp. An120]
MASKTFGKEQILASFFDEGAYTVLFARSAVSAAFGSANGQPVYAICQDGEAVTVADVDKCVKVLDMAVKTGNPVVTFYDSTGACLSEGLGVLTAQARWTEKIAQISGVVPQLAVVTGVCGVSSALAAAAADVCIAAEGCEIFFTAPFTSAAAGDKVEGAGSAELAAKAGVAAVVAKDAAEAVATAARLVAMLPANNLSAPAMFDAAEPAAALDLNKYTAAGAAAAVVDADSAVELFGGFAKGVYTALATVAGNPVGVVATEPGALCRYSVSKAARFVRLCDAFSLPVVTLVNSEGFSASVSEDVAGAIREAARLAGTYADATTARVAVLTGKAVGPVYTALANADLTIAVQGCTVSAVDPKVAVTVLYKDELDASDNIVNATAAKASAYAAESCSADAALAAGVADFAVAPAQVRSTLAAALDMLATKRTQRLPKKHGNMAL